MQNSGEFVQGFAGEREVVEKGASFAAEIVIFRLVLVGFCEFSKLFCLKLVESRCFSENMRLKCVEINKNVAK